MTQLDIPSKYVQQAVAAPQKAEIVWRRTRDGWEKADTFLPAQKEVVLKKPSTPLDALPLHPAGLAVWMLTVSLAALVAFPAAIMGAPTGPTSQSN
jgi:hypothetical protein